jgi:hypothetical protein
MRNAAIAPVSDAVKEAETLYGRFDLSFEGLPRPAWIARNLMWYRFHGPMRHAFFPEIFIYKTLINRRMRGAIDAVFADFHQRWTKEAAQAHGIDQFVKCYCFGDGQAPNLFWYGAAWEISPQVVGAELDEVILAFKRAGFTHDRKKLRTFEYW